MNLNRLVPEKLVRVRPARKADRIHLARWVEHGREEGVFRKGNKLTASSVLRYQDRIRRLGCEYRCLIIETNGEPIGYLDYCRQRRSAEIFGIYLEPRFRYQRIGRHMLRWVIAQMRELGCRMVTTEVYADNAASVRADRAVGFMRDPSRDRVEDGKIIHAFCKHIDPFKRLSPEESLYKRLQGDNIYLHHVAVAEAIVEQIRHLRGVEIILGLGSLARGFADKWSDVDLAVLGRGEGLNRLWRGERLLAGLSIDLFVVDLDAAPPTKWDSSRRQAFEESIVLFTRAASVLHSVSSKISLGKGERTGKIHETLLKIGWIGFQPRDWFGQNKYGYDWSLPHDLWIRRGCASSAHATIDQALDYAIQLLFLANGQHVPDLKWRRYLATGLPWVPTGFSSLIKEADYRRRDKQGFSSRAAAVRSIIEKTVHHLQKTGVIKGNLYKSYLRISPDYNPRA